MFCRFCGSTISDDSVFCTVCGKNLGVAEQQPTQQNMLHPQPHSQSSQYGYNQAPSTKALILNRKFDLQAMAHGIHVIVDGEEVAFLGSKCDGVVVPITQGTHEISAVVTYGLKKVYATLPPAVIHVGYHNIIVEFSIKRGAWSANWQMKAGEDVEDTTAHIQIQ